MATFFEKLTNNSTNKYIQFMVVLLLTMLFREVFPFFYDIFTYELIGFYHNYEGIAFGLLVTAYILFNKDKYSFIPALLLGVLILFIFAHYVSGCIAFILIAYLIENTPSETSSPAN